MSDIFSGSDLQTGEYSEALASLIADLNAVVPEARKAISAAADRKAIEQLRVQFLGKKGRITKLNQRLGKLSGEERPVAGKLLNTQRTEITALLEKRTAELEVRELESRIAEEAVDVTLPGIRPARGGLHPVTRVTREIEEIFRSMGFRLESGPEVETEWLNFDALNMPEDHPARDMQDTFYTERGHVLRTHTSPTQLRSMLAAKPPLAVITTGKVYRHDSDATHSPMFHQMEGFLVDEAISMGHLKGVLHEFLRALYGPDVRTRFRPSFFPFTEPSAEVDIWFEARGGWMEVLGCGMIHPAVLRNGGIDPERYSGFAFGLGIDRMTCIKFGIPDLRLLFENDLRFLRQFQG